jgi:hypothetical protein
MQGETASAPSGLSGGPGKRIINGLVAKVSLDFHRPLGLTRNCFVFRKNVAAEQGEQKRIHPALS